MSFASYTIIAPSSMPPSPTTPTQTTLMSEEQMDLVEILRSGEDSRLRRHRPERADPAAALSAVVLFCGADQENEADWDEHRPWTVAILPDTTPPPARKRQKRSNGCGARIHARAIPDRRWRGMLDGVSGDVVPLQDQYFTPDMKRELLMGKERCGCSRSGVGCSICGNALGALFTPCARHAPSSANTNFSSSHYTFLRSAVSPPLPLLTRPVSSANREIMAGRAERESLQRRMRDREEIQQLRARARAGQPSTRPADERRQELTRPGDIRRAERERRAREDHIAEMMESEVDDGRAFEAWADATIQRATATAASPVPDGMVDLTALMRGGPVAPRELSEEERRTDWDRGIVMQRAGYLGVNGLR
ncbi:hypothetical protein B0H10DRAFT_2188622 [Mycena sp. CBHHK59/15]|nr:hypothetical protein B0H10DRAFT_2188622 [Mycena sp. CBHHK59/15]